MVLAARRRDVDRAGARRAARTLARLRRFFGGNAVGFRLIGRALGEQVELELAVLAAREDRAVHGNDLTHSGFARQRFCRPISIFQTRLKVV